MMNFILKIMIACMLLPWSLLGLLFGGAMIAVMFGSETASDVLNTFEQLFFN